MTVEPRSAGAFSLAKSVLRLPVASARLAVCD
jgi:hypothetical protein